MKKNNYIYFKSTFYFSIYILILAGLIPLFSYHTQNDVFYKFFIVVSNRWFIISCLFVTSVMTIKFQNLSCNYLYYLRFPSLRSVKKRTITHVLYYNAKIIILALLFLFFSTFLVAGFNTLYSLSNVVYVLKCFALILAIILFNKLYTKGN